jgi:hypothetical protein
VEGFVLHEHHVTNFKTSHKVLNRGTEVTTASPDIFDEGNLIRFNAQLLSKPSVVELNAFVLEEGVLLWIVEHLDAQHDEATVMSASDADVV